MGINKILQVSNFGGGIYEKENYFLNSKRIKISTFVKRRDIHGKYLL